MQSTDSPDDEHDDMTTGSSYAQLYFDGWVWVLCEGGPGPSGTTDPGTSDADNADILTG